MFYLSCLILTAEMHQKTADLYLLGSRGAAVPNCKSLPQASCVQVPEKDEAMAHWLPALAPGPCWWGHPFLPTQDSPGPARLCACEL